LLGAGPTAAQTAPAVVDTDAALTDIISDPRFLAPVDARAPMSRKVSEAYPAISPKGSRVSQHLDELQAIDPYEGINRFAHGFNALLRRHLLDPVALEWLESTERSTQEGVSNVFANLREPITIVNNLLLGDLDGASNATYRFAINTTAGVGGYYDVASDLGATRRPRTLEEVLCIYGVPAGPYAVVPVLGPGTVRDAAGRLTTLLVSYSVLGPIYIPYRISDIIIQYVGVREQLKFIDSISVDSYTAQKSATLQVRRMSCEGQSAALIRLFGQQ
jgi:phospholipid-binding lipoprotein MlaA